MSLIVEDGTIVDGAESYISVADADIEIDKRGGDDGWKNATVTQKEVQLRLATEYLDNEYCFIGYTVSNDQELSWPRGGTKYDSDIIPDIVKRATAVLAVASLDLPLYNDVAGTSSTGGRVKRTKDKLDVLETSVEYFESGSAFGSASQTSFVEVGRILRSVLEGISAYRG